MDVLGVIDIAYVMYRSITIKLHIFTVSLWSLTSRTHHKSDILSYPMCYLHTMTCA